MHIGIDASSIRFGGGISHLAQLIAAIDPETSDVHSVTIWGGRQTLEQLPRHSVVRMIHVPTLDRSAAHRLLWQTTRLSRSVVHHGCNALFTPGGTYVPNKPCPVISMSQNLLPFEPHEFRRFGLSRRGLRYAALRMLQGRSFSSSDGVVFLTEYARRLITTQIRKPVRRAKVIPHGVDERFRKEPRPQVSPAALSGNRPFRFVYVSFLKTYKHQNHVAMALGSLREQGVPVAIDFVGPATEEARTRFEAVLARSDPTRRYLRYLGPAPFATLHEVYHRADGFLFASSCENMPNILLEAMAGGLPIACSNRGPMPEVLGDAGVFFDPEDVVGIGQAVRRLVESAELRQELAWKSYRRALQFTWERCALSTVTFIREVARSGLP